MAKAAPAPFTCSRFHRSKRGEIDGHWPATLYG